jgi:hypothetical protein
VRTKAAADDLAKGPEGVQSSPGLRRSGTVSRLPKQLSGRMQRNAQMLAPTATGLAAEA